MFEDGDCFCESALLRNEPRAIVVRALTTVSYLTLKREHFVALVARVPGLRETLDQLARAKLLDGAAFASMAELLTTGKFDRRAVPRDPAAGSWPPSRRRGPSLG